MELKNYQERAIEELLTKTLMLLPKTKPTSIVFKAPTGSGKTIMMAEYLKRLVTTRGLNKTLCFIWAAPGKLHLQSKTKLARYYEESRVLDCVDFFELTERAISENEILFLNWESINKKNKNTIVKENEQDFYLNKIIENTKEKGIDIILVIDESHHHATSAISKDLINDILPKHTIEVSATPVLKDYSESVIVQFDDVIQEGMIKKLIQINPGFKNSIIKNNIVSKLSEGTDFEILDIGIHKLNEISTTYNNLGINVNPLLLIQLPDNNPNQVHNRLKDELEARLREKYNVSTTNGKLAIYLSEEHENLENISKNESAIEVMMFKQAIALGWDCPRAHILVLFRDLMSVTFTVQTIGRIMRMPEPSNGHYNSDILNHAYVYTNVSDLIIKEDLAKEYLTTYSSNRIESYESIKLTSVHSKRYREKTRLSPKFTELFMEQAEKYELCSKIQLEGQSVSRDFITDYTKDSIDELTNTHVNSDFSINNLSDRDLQLMFDDFVIKQLSPFFPESRSIGRLKDCIYRFFKDKLLMDYSIFWTKIINIVLSVANNYHFINIISDTKQEYQTITDVTTIDLEEDLNWEIPDSISYNANYEELSRLNKSVMQPFYYEKQGWHTEVEFMYFIDNKSSIEWWFKNGAGFGTYFAVPYIENSVKKPFYPDFIIKFFDGSIGLYDTKSGKTITEAKDKSDGLQQYIIKHNQLGMRLKGGIVTNSDQITYQGSWLVFTGSSIDLNKDILSNWENLVI